MLSRNGLIFLIIFFTGKSLALFCSETNTSCDAIKTKDGYKFSLNVPEGSTIYLTENEISIGYAPLGNRTSFILSPAVLNVDNTSFTTKNCRDVTVHFVAPVGFSDKGQLVKDFCNKYIVIADKTDLVKANLNHLLGIVCSIIGIIVIFGLVYLCLKRQHIGGFFRHLWTFCPLQKTEAKGEPRGPLGHDEDNEQGTALERVVIRSTEADVNTPQSPSVDRNLSTERIQRTKNELDTGGAAGNRAEHDETEVQPLLTSKRFDMTGEAGPLANKAGFDRDGVSRCSPVPNTDVESQEIQEVGTGSNQ